MFNKKSILAYIVVMMFSLFGKVEAKYEKLFFELNIKSNSGKDIDLVKYKKKLFFWLMLQASVVLQSSILDFKCYMTNTKIRALL